VKYDDGDQEEDVDADKIRPLTSTVSSFRTGQRVQANYKAKGDWYPGLVRRVVDACCYSVRYDDGDTESCVDPLLMRRAATGTCEDSNDEPCRAGYSVSANWRNYGRYYSATVTSCSQGIFTLRYADGDTGSQVTSSRLRNCRAPPRCNTATLRRLNSRVEANYRGRGDWHAGVVSNVNRSTCTMCVRYDDGDTECGLNAAKTRNPTNQCYRNLTGMYAPQSLVSANWRGQGNWYPAKICGCNTRTPPTFYLCYADGDKEARVPANRIRRRN